MTPDVTRPTCFIAMPVATRPEHLELYEEDGSHWEHVMKSLFMPAAEAAGFTPLAPVMVGAPLIHEQIIKNLESADLVLCDLSSHNPNVLFELGIRTALNKPISLVRDEHTDLPFDTGGINTHTYASTLRGWELETQRARLKEHLENSAASCAGTNPMWRRFGLTLVAHQPSVSVTPEEAKFDLLMQEFSDLKRHVVTAQDRGLRMTSVEPHDHLHAMDDVSPRFIGMVGEILGDNLRSIKAEDDKVVITYADSPDRALKGNVQAVRELARDYNVPITLRRLVRMARPRRSATDTDDG